MSGKLSPVFLSFTDIETSNCYARDKKIYYSKLMPVITIITLQLTAVLELLKRGPA
jgi:hypothetical protein